MRMINVAVNTTLKGNLIQHKSKVRGSGCWRHHKPWSTVSYLVFFRGVGMGFKEQRDKILVFHFAGVVQGSAAILKHNGAALQLSHHTPQAAARGFTSRGSSRFVGDN